MEMLLESRLQPSDPADDFPCRARGLIPAAAHWHALGVAL
jgi:hypothetical protein